MVYSHGFHRKGYVSVFVKPLCESRVLSPWGWGRLSRVYMDRVKIQFVVSPHINITLAERLSGKKHRARWQVMLISLRGGALRVLTVRRGFGRWFFPSHLVQSLAKRLPCLPRRFLASWGDPGSRASTETGFARVCAESSLIQSHSMGWDAL